MITKEAGTHIGLQNEAAELIQGFIQGDIDSGTQLGSLINRIAKRRLRRLNASEQECEELAQECAVNVIQRIADYKEDLGNFDSWVSGFAHNTWRAYVRATVRTRNATVPIDSVGELGYEIDSDVNRRENLSTALDSLELIDQELLHMRYGLGMSSDEIAEASDMNPPQVRKRISRAVERLRRHPATQALLMSLGVF